MKRMVALLFAALLVVLPLALALAGCPRLPEPDGCTPRAMRCNNGVPEVCSPTQRWTPADRPCTEVGAVCCATRSPFGREVRACVPPDRCQPEPTDGGAE